jgi:hypothetical protein
MPTKTVKSALELIAVICIVPFATMTCVVLNAPHYVRA